MLSSQFTLLRLRQLTWRSNRLWGETLFVTFTACEFLVFCMLKQLTALLLRRNEAVTTFEILGFLLFNTVVV
jgi:hypothetical protein